MPEVKKLGDMETARVLRDLGEKYKKDEDAGVVGSMGSVDVLADLKKKADARERALDGIVPERRMFSAEEIGAMQAADCLIRDFLDDFGDGTDPNDLVVLERRLDALPLWKAKFASGDRGLHDELFFDEKMNSVYYMTPSGASLRLKKAVFFDNDLKSRRGGPVHLSLAVYPFAEIVLFKNTQNPDARYDLVPAIGLTVKEYYTTTLNAALREKNPVSLKSGIHIYQDPLGVKDVICPVDVRAGVHDGHYVNKIFFTR